MYPSPQIAENLLLCWNIDACNYFHIQEVWLFLRNEPLAGRVIESMEID